jgi:hypothetical protein
MMLGPRYPDPPLQFHILEATMAQTEIDPAPESPRAGKKTRARIDWKRGAALLVAGETPAAVAAVLGITEERLWRHLRGSARFQFLLRQARETQLLLGRLQLEAASNAAAIRCAQKAEKPPAGLFEQFKSSSTPAWAQPSSADGRDMVLRLADSLRRAPKRAPRAVNAADTNKADISVDKGEIRENKTQISENKPALSAEKSAVPAETAAEPALPSRRVPLPVSARGDSGIVDLTDIYGNPLPGTRIGTTANGTPARADAWPG